MSEANEDKKNFVPLSEKTKRILERVQSGSEEPPTEKEIQEANEIEQRVKEISDAERYEDYLEQHPEIVESMYEESQKPYNFFKPRFQRSKNASAQEAIRQQRAQINLNRRVPSTSAVESRLPITFRASRFIKENEIPQKVYRYGIDIPAKTEEDAIKNAVRGYKILKRVSGIPINQRGRLRKRTIKTTRVN